MIRKTLIINFIMAVFFVTVLSAQDIKNFPQTGPLKPFVTQSVTSLLQLKAVSFPMTAGKELSAGKAFLLSMLIPGAGEYYAGSKKMALTFIGSEVVLWSAYFTTRTLGNWQQKDAVTWAASHAGVDLNNREHEFFIAVENYNNLRDYNNAKLQQRDVAGMYPEDSEHMWQWDSEASRLKFEKTRVTSDAWYNRSKFIVAGVILNHLISGIDAVRLVKQKNAIHVGVAGLPEGGFIFMASRLF